VGFQILAKYLKIQVEDARENKLRATRQAPMYGLMSAIRLILQKLRKEDLDLGKPVLNKLIKTSSYKGLLGLAFNNYKMNFKIHFFYFFRCMQSSIAGFSGC